MIRTSADIIALLHQCTVRIETGSSHGTGCFVAPGLILTCAHVVAKVKPHTPVALTWQNQAGMATIAAQRDSQYPDIALIQVQNAHWEHPCAYLDATVAIGDPLYVFGYTDEYREGDSGTYECEGYSQDPYLLKIKGGQVRPGMSGAPVLNQVTGKVCGVMKLSRDRGTDLGGRAVPMAAVLAEFPDIAPAQQQIHQQNPMWQRLLPLQMETSTYGLQADPQRGIVLTESGNRRAPHPLPLPIFQRPAKPPAAVVGREQALAQGTQALVAQESAEFYGEAGIGKTTVLQKLTHEIPSDRFTAGIVYDLVQHHTVDDLLQNLFDTFYLSEPEYKPSRAEIRRSLGSLSALIVLDEAARSPVDINDLRNLVPNFTFLVANGKPCLLNGEASIGLTGLTPEESRDLIQRSLGRELAPPEGEAALLIGQALKGHPQTILQHLSSVKTGQESLLELAQRLKTEDQKDVLIGFILNRLGKPQRLVLIILLALGGLALSAQEVQAMSALPGVSEVLGSLTDFHLVEGKGARYRIAQNLVSQLQGVWDTAPYLEKAIAFFIQYLSSPPTLSVKRWLDIADIAAQLMEWAIAQQQWTQALALGRGIEPALIVCKQWGLWQQVLVGQLTAARQLGDGAAIAWALHQQGSYALTQGNGAVGQSLLTEALQLQLAQGNEVGATVTRHNLNLGLNPPPLYVPEPATASSPSFDAGSLTSVAQKGALVALPLVGVVGVGWLAVSLLTGLPAPGNVQVALVAPNTAEISWEDRSDLETGFVVEVRENRGGFAPIPGGALPANATSFEHSNLAGNTAYAYRVIAQSEQKQARSRVVKLLTLPIALTNVQAQGESATQVNLTWQDPNPRPAKVQVLRATAAERQFEPVGTARAGAYAFTDKNLQSDTEYIYWVKAVNDTGESAIAEVTAKTLPAAPSAPQALEATARSSTEVYLTWRDTSTNETGFILERRTDDGEFQPLTIPIPPDATEVVDTTAGLLPETRYTYRLRAINRSSSGEYLSDYSNEVRVTTPAARPGTPLNLRVLPESLSRTGVTLAWDDTSASETAFVIEQSQAGGDFQIVGEVAANATTWSAQNLQPNRTYFYRVKAVGSSGSSDYSNTVTVEITLPTPGQTPIPDPETDSPPLPPLLRPAAPSDLRSQPESGAVGELMWQDNSPDDLGFVLEQSVSGGPFQEIARIPPEKTSEWGGFGRYSSHNVNRENLQPNRVYAFRVKAIGANGDSDYSNTITQHTYYIAPPENLTAAWSTNQQGRDVIILNWQWSGQRVEGFRIERDGPGGSDVFIVSADARQYEDADVSLWFDDSTFNYGAYLYRVYAIVDGVWDEPAAVEVKQQRTPQ